MSLPTLDDRSDDRRTIEHWMQAVQQAHREVLVITFASGRFAMIDGGLGFQLVPWTPSLEKQIGRHVSGVAREDGGVDWSFGRKRDMGIWI